MLRRTRRAQIVLSGCVAAGCMLPATIFAQRDASASSRGEVRAERMFSPALGVSKRYVIYLPPSYERDSARRFPVAYFLHGTGGDERSWIAGARIDSVLDSLAAAGTSEMIVVMPDGDNSFYHTWASQSPDYGACVKQVAARLAESPADFCVHHMRYDDYIAHDLVGHVDSMFRTLADGKHRAVAGMSMGGYGAVYLPLTRPDVFAVGASLSGAGLSLLRVGGSSAPGSGHEATSMAELRSAWKKLWPETVAEIGDDIPHWRALDPVTIASASVSAHRALPALWFVVGTEDESTLAGNRDLHDMLTRLSVPHVYIEASGGHTAQFWRDHEAECLVWLAQRMTP